MTPQETWAKTCEAFRRIAMREGIEKVADEILADRSTVYRMVRGDTTLPTLAVRRGIERIVEQHQDSP